MFSCFEQTKYMIYIRKSCKVVVSFHVFFRPKVLITSLSLHQYLSQDSCFSTSQLGLLSTLPLPLILTARHNHLPSWAAIPDQRALSFVQAIKLTSQMICLYGHEHQFSVALLTIPTSRYSSMVSMFSNLSSPAAGQGTASNWQPPTAHHIFPG